MNDLGYISAGTIIPLWVIMKKKVVIAIFETDPLNRFIYQKMLEPQRDRVSFHIFNSAEEGLGKAAELACDVAFIDMHMHGKFFGGLDIVKKLKMISDQTTMIAMTTLIQDGDVERATSGGFFKCTEKPLPFFDLDKLLVGIIDI